MARNPLRIEDLIHHLRHLVTVSRGARGGYTTLERTLGLTPATLSRFASGKQTPNAEAFVKLMSHFDIQLSVPGDSLYGHLPKR